MHEEQTEYDDHEMAQLYNQLPDTWLLLEVIQRSATGKPTRLKLLKTAKDKNTLYDYLFEEAENWNWDKDYIFVFSDPTRTCPIF